MRPGSRIRNVIAASVMMLFVTYYVNATDALQSAMEAKRMKNDWLSSVSEAKNAFTRLSSYAGGIAVSGVQDMLPWLMNHIRQPKISWIHMHPPFQKMLKPYWKIEYSVINREIPVCSNFSKRNVLMMRFWFLLWKPSGKNKICVILFLS